MRASRSLKQQNKKGFTLVELVVTGVILLILLGIGGGSIVKYQQYSTFKKNNDYARTIFSAAQSSLSYLKTGGGLDAFTEGLTTCGTDGTLVALDMTEEIYGTVIEANKNNPAALKDIKFYQLLKDYVADKTVMNAAIRIEFQKSNGNVTAVYYCDHANNLVVGPLGKSGDELGIGDPTAEGWDAERREYYLGYYGSEAVANPDVSPALEIPQFKDISVKKGNILDVNWSLKVKDSNPEVDVKNLKAYNYRVQLYNSADKNYAAEEFYFLGKDITNSLSGSVECYSLDGTKKEYTTRAYIEDDRVHLVLDAIDLGVNSDFSNLQSTYSIGRFKNLNLGESIFAKVAVFSEDLTADFDSDDEAATISFHPTMEQVSGKTFMVSCVRHLYNIRFIEKEDSQYQYFLNGDIDWQKAIANKEIFRSTALVTDVSNAAFPAIPLLGKESVFNGKNKKLENFIFDSHSPEYVGLFGVNNGAIRDVTLRHTVIANKQYTYAGMACGKNIGTIGNVNVFLSGEKPMAVDAQYAGGLAGMTKGNVNEAYVWGKIENAGGVTGGIIGLVAEDAASGIAITDCMTRGSLASGSNAIRGGIVGLWKGKNGRVYDCKNRMNIRSGDNAGGIVGAHNSDNSNSKTELLIDKCRNYGKPTEIEEKEPKAYEYEFAGILGSRVENKNTKTSITNCYGVADVMYPITSYTMQTEQEIGSENLVKDDSNYYFIEPSSDVEIADIVAPRGSWEWLTGTYKKGKMVDQSTETRYEVSILESRDKLSITFYFEKESDLSDITIDWYNSPYMKSITYSIHNGEKATSDNNVLMERIVCDSFVNSHGVVKTDLTVDNGNPLKTKALTIYIEDCDIQWGKLGQRPGIWEVLFNSSENSEQIDRDYGAGLPLNTRWLSVSGVDGWCGCYTDTVGGRVSRMQMHPHAAEDNVTIYNEVDKHLYNTAFSGDYEPGGDQTLEPPTDVYFNLYGDWIDETSENTLLENEFYVMNLTANAKTDAEKDVAGSYQMRAGIYSTASEFAEPVVDLKKEMPDISGDNYIWDMDGDTLGYGGYRFNNVDLWDYSGDYYIGINVRKRSNGLTSPWSKTYFCKIPTVQLDTPVVSVIDNPSSDTTLEWTSDHKADAYRLVMSGNDGNEYELIISTRANGNGDYQVDLNINGFSNALLFIKGAASGNMWIDMGNNAYAELRSQYHTDVKCWTYQLALDYIVDENGNQYPFMDYFEMTALAMEDSQYVDSDIAWWGQR